MKLKTKKAVRRSIAGISAMTIAVSALPSMSVFAVTGNTHYDYDGYSVDYTVTNEWIGHQNVSVKLTNTSDEPILNWAVGYDAHGDIEGIWNGYISAKDDEGYIIKNAGYNYEIAPGSSVSYGYTLSGLDLSVPETFDILSKRLDKTDGYVVNFNKVNDWGTGFQGEIVVLNTSSEPLEAWSVGFESTFEINSLWGGKILSHEGNHYELSSESWTNPIAPDSQVTIGFIGMSENGSTSISNTKLSSVVTGRGNEIVIDDTELSLNADGEYVDGKVDLAWQSTVNNGSYEILYSTDNAEYTTVGTTKSNTYTYAVDKDTSGDVYFKIRQTAKDGRIAESPIVVVNIPAPVIILKPEVTLTAEYDEESGFINASWESTVPNGFYKVTVSLDGEEISSCDIEDTNNYSFKPEKSGEYTIKVVHTTEKGMTGEKSAAVNVVISGHMDSEIDWEDETDTDNDGIPDVYEVNYFNTDPNKADTDGDSLPDGYEVMSLGTDPTKSDSDENGINDGDEDADEDKLTNKEEYTLGTSPIEKDTDQDGLSDYDEVNSYGTDPLKYDTDGDGISDGDEITLGLDPLNAATNGTPDSEHTFVQHIGADSDNLCQINTEENPYKLSVDIIAAGNALNNFYSEESGYAGYVANETILGVVPEFYYPEDLKVEKITLKFEIEDTYIPNADLSYAGYSEELMGIKRYNVFKFFEDIGMMLPIETHHDAASNMVYADVDEIGSYCLVDMEKWFKKLGVEFDNNNTQTMNALAGIGAKSDITMAGYEDEQNSETDTKKYDKYIDVVIVPYTNAGYLDYVKTEITSTCEKIYTEAKDRNIGIRIHFISWTGDVFPNNNNGTN